MDLKRARSTCPMTGITFAVRDALAGIRHGRKHRAAIAENLRTIRDVETAAIRITTGPAGRCFELPNGWLVTIRNEQPPDSSILHGQWVVSLTTEDAEDFYGWSQ